MPRITMTAEQAEQRAEKAAPVALGEYVVPAYLSTDHAVAQLIERLAWATSDAEELERAV